MISHKLASIISAASIAATGAVATVGSADAATVTQGATGVVYGTGGSPIAAYSSPAGSWTLASPASSGASAQVDLVKPAQPSTTTAPTMTATNYGAGDPRLVLEFHNGQYLFGFPTGSNGALSWSDEPSGTAETTWSDALAAVNAGGADNSLTAAFVVQDSGSTATTVITDLTYNGEAVVPVSNSDTQSPLGEIVNAHSGKCLDVGGGSFTAGARLQQYTCGAKSANGVTGGDEQFEIVTRTRNGATTGYLEAVSTTGSVFYVSAATAGGQLTLSSAKSAAADMLKSGSYYTFPEAPGSTTSTPQVMDVSGAGTANRAKVISYPLNHGTNQQWSLP